MKPYILNQITDLAISEPGTDIFANTADAQVKQESYVLFFATRETTNVEVQLLSGDVQVMKKGPANINATVGTVPNRDDYLGATVVRQGERIQAMGSNADGAAARELRVRCLVVPTALADRVPGILQLFTP